MTNGKINAGDYNTGHYNTGDFNVGNYNTGDLNAGNWNTGDLNAGNCNLGNCNVGSHNTGRKNTGDYNVGPYNTGDYNVGRQNTGHHNTGCYNTGAYNTGNHNAGYCNTVTPEDVLIFNKPGKRSEWVDATKPQWMQVTLTQWITESEMSDKEKQEYPTYTTTGGYLKFYTSLKHAYIESWEKASKEDRELTYKLPNFDPIVFEEIFGFNPCACVEENRVHIPINLDVIEINGVKYKKI